MPETSTRRLLVRLLIHFGCWWAVWGLLLEKGYRGLSLAFVLAHPGPIASDLMAFAAAPVTGGIFYLRYGNGQWTEWLGIAGICVSLALIAATFLALRYKWRWAVWSAHTAVVAYWLVGFAVLAEGA